MGNGIIEEEGDNDGVLSIGVDGDCIGGTGDDSEAFLVVVIGWMVLMVLSVH